MNVHCSSHHHNSVYVLRHRSRQFYHGNVPLGWFVLPDGAREMTFLAQVGIDSRKLQISLSSVYAAKISCNDSNFQQTALSSLRNEK